MNKCNYSATRLLLLLASPRDNISTDIACNFGAVCWFNCEKPPDRASFLISHDERHVFERGAIIN